MPHSHHSHSGQFCRHATGCLQDVVLEAVRKGFELYGLSEHVPRYRSEDLYPEEDGLSLDVLASQFDDFLDEAHRLKALYANDITLLVGLETELITPTDLNSLEDLLKKHSGRIQYLVGSVHHVNGIPIDFDLPTFHAAVNSCTSTGTPSSQIHDRQAHFLSVYLDAQYTLLCRFQPEIIGHIDLCRLYTPSLRFCDYPQALAKLERNIRFAVAYGALFEVNSAAFRKGWDTAYPGDDVAEVIIQHGGRFGMSDDSHGPHMVGLNYDRAAAYLQRLGVRELWHLRYSPVPNAAGRHVCAVQANDGCWWEHPFWTR